MSTRHPLSGPHSLALALLSSLGVVATAAAADAHAVDFEVGYEHNCVANDCGWVHCWGNINDTFGETKDTYAPALGPQKAFDVAVGMDHSCAMWRDDLSMPGYVECWGRNDWGQLDVPMETNWRRIDGGWMHNCGIDWSYDVKCWGSDDVGESSDVPFGAKFNQVSAGTELSCGVSRGSAPGNVVGESLFCWGGADPKTNTPLLPAGVARLDAADLPDAASNRRFTKVSAGFVHACALDTRGRIYCWGNNGAEAVTPLFDHKANLPYFTEASVEVEGGSATIFVNDRGEFLDVSASSLATCAVFRLTQTQNAITCWGFPFSFDQTVWAGESRASDPPIPPGFNPTRVELAPSQVCAMDDATKEIVCWSTYYDNDMGVVPDEVLTCE